MLDVIVLRRALPSGRDLKDGDGLVEGLAGGEILVGLAGLQHARIADLMARHADVVGELAGEPCGIDDGWICPLGIIVTAAHSFDVCRAGAVAVFTTYRGLGEDRVLILPGKSGNGLRTAAVAGDATWQEDAVKS